MSKLSSLAKTILLNHISRFHYSITNDWILRGEQLSYIIKESRPY